MSVTEILKIIATGTFLIISGVLIFWGVYKTPIKSHRDGLGYLGATVLVVAGVLYLLDKFTPFSFL